MPEQPRLCADQVRVVSITREKNPPYDEKSDNMRVVFRIGNSETDYPVFVSRKDFSDEQLIRAARYYLYYQAQELADATRGWNLEAAEHDRLMATGEASQNANI